MSLDTLAKFNSLATLRETTVEPAPGLSLKVRELTLAERLEYARIVKDSSPHAGVVYLLRTSVRDPESGAVLFPEDYDFSNVSPEVIENLGREILTVSGMIPKGAAAGN